ncbi:MAG: flagellar basal body rod protein FlgB [Cellulosilyticaceae bacterium]
MFHNLDITNKALDGIMLRYNVLSANIANSETVGYKRQDVKFQDLLEKEMSNKGTEGIDINQIEPQVYTDNLSFAQRLDGNNVDIDKEMGELSKTKLRYDTLVQRTNAQISRYKYILQNIK